VTAADGIARVLRYDAWSKYLTTLNMTVVAILLVGGVGYCSGRSNGEQIGRQAVSAVIRTALADSSRAIEARVDARYQALAFAEQARTAASDLHTAARQTIRLVSDTVVSVVRATDTLRVDVPVEVVQVIATADTLIARQDSTIALSKALVADLTKDRDVWQHRALLDEDELRRAKGPRFGLKTGVVLGVLASAALVSAFR
jgi:hypothetical protein